MFVRMSDKNFFVISSNQYPRASLSGRRQKTMLTLVFQKDSLFWPFVVEPCCFEVSSHSNQMSSSGRLGPTSGRDLLGRIRLAARATDAKRQFPSPGISENLRLGGTRARSRSNNRSKVWRCKGGTGGQPPQN